MKAETFWLEKILAKAVTHRSCVFWQSTIVFIFHGENMHFCYMPKCYFSHLYFKYPSKWAIAPWYLHESHIIQWESDTNESKRVRMSNAGQCVSVHIHIHMHTHTHTHTYRGKIWQNSMYWARKSDRDSTVIIIHLLFMYRCSLSREW